MKDVSIIKNREAHKSIIVDNSVMCFISCLNNGIYIKTFDGSCNDNELKPLFTFLEKIKDAKDVSEEIRNEFNLEERYHEYKKKRKKKARKYDDWAIISNLELRLFEILIRVKSSFVNFNLIILDLI